MSQFLKTFTLSIPLGINSEGDRVTLDVMDLAVYDTVPLMASDYGTRPDESFYYLTPIEEGEMRLRAQGEEDIHCLKVFTKYLSREENRKDRTVPATRIVRRVYKDNEELLKNDGKEQEELYYLLTAISEEDVESLIATAN